MREDGKNQIPTWLIIVSAIVAVVVVLVVLAAAVWMYALVMSS